MSITESAREEITDTVGRLRATFATGLTRPVEWRKGQLKALRRLLVDHDDVFAEALRVGSREGRH